MPNRPIDFKFTSDVVRLLNGLDKAELSVEDLEQAFVEASNSSADLERKIAKATREAEQDVEKLERAIKDLPDATGDAARKIDADMDRVGDSFGDAGQEASQEFKQNLGESLSSGDLSSIIQDTAGGLVSGLSGPLSILAAGVAGVTALAFAEVKKQAEELAGFTESLGGVIRSLYDQGVKTRDALRTLEAFNTFLDEQADKIQDLEDDWRTTGLSQDDYLTSIFEGGAALDAQRDKILAVIAATEAQAASAEGPTLESLKQNAAAQELLRYLEAQAAEQGDITGEMNNTSSASRELAERLGLVDTNMDGIIDESDKLAGDMAAAAESSLKLKNNLANLPKGATFTIKYDATGFTGGAFQVTGGQLRPVEDFGPRQP